MSRKKIAEDIFLAAIEAVSPSALVPKNIFLSGSKIYTGGLSLDLEKIDNVYVIGAGKASAAMACAVEKILDRHISGGLVVVKYGHSVPLNRIKVTEAGHPLPDRNGFEATSAIADIDGKAGPNDLILCLLSGGGSSLLADLPEGVTERELILLNDILVKSGADISEINTVRKHLSGIKGGRLASIIYPATLVSLILSDVPGDSPDVIASGPTYPDGSTFADAIRILSDHGIQKIIPESILAHINKGVQGLIKESPKMDDPVFNKAYNVVIGNNMTALKAASFKAKGFGFRNVIIMDEMNGDTSDFAKIIVQSAIECQEDSKVEKPACLLFGGETTLKVTGNGTGGRNQHMALSCAIQIKGRRGITILAAGTDGTDYRRHNHS